MQGRRNSRRKMRFVSAQRWPQSSTIYRIKLTPEERQAYDYAMRNSNEKGPCCCKCWRWHVYGGLGKYLIKNHGFTGKQLAQLWDLSDGCGGDDEHHH